MSDDEPNPAPAKRNKKKGLPPISTNKEDGDENAVRPVRKKKKAQAVKKEDVENVDEEKPVPRRRRKRSPSQTKATEDSPAPATDTTTAAPKKKKRKPKAAAEDGAKENENQNADAEKTEKDVQGSKTSLLSKETPRGKKTGKKKKKVRKKPIGEEYEESPWAEDLKTMEDDIITGHREDGDGEEEEDDEGGTKKMATTFVTQQILQSQPMDKLFVETSSRFKGQNKKTLAMQPTVAPEPTIKDIPKMTTADFALATNSVFRVITLFLHGLTAGVALWQMVMIYFLASFSVDDFLEHYYNLAMPLQGSLYFLLAVCTVSVCDRFDISRPNRRFVLRALTLQNGASSVLLCLVALVINVVAIRYEDRMSLFKDYDDLYTNSNVSKVYRADDIALVMKSEEIDTFRSLNTARSIFIVLSWLILSLTPNTDRLGNSLKSGRTGLEMELDQISSA